jgi:hypothetical protein
MRLFLGRLLAVIGLAASLGAVSTVVLGADLGASRPQQVEPADPDLLRTDLSNYLDLLMIRSMFDVLAADRVAPEFTAKAAGWGRGGPNADEQAALDSALLGEAGYFITSIRYTVEVGGAVFPGDRSEQSYANDTIIQLTALQQQLVDAINAHQPIHPIVFEAQRLYALTSGETEVPAGQDKFASHETLLNTVLDRLTKGVPT